MRVWPELLKPYPGLEDAPGKPGWQRALALRFPPVLEQAFDESRCRDRILRYRFSLLLGVALYDTFLVTDYIYLRPIFGFCLVVRLCVATPVALLLVALVSRVGPGLREVFLAFTAAPGVLTLLPLYAATGNPQLIAASQAAFMLFLLYPNLVVQTRFPHASAATVLYVLVDAAVMMSSGPAHGVATAIFAGIVFSAAVLSILASYRMERHERMQYLLRQNNEAQNAKLATMNQELARLSALDPLTGIANRRLFDSELRRQWSRCLASRQPLAVLMIDMDRFKRVNDSYGHSFGDEALCAVAKALRDGLREEQDFVARYGGEEFVVILPNRHMESALQIGERLCEAVRALALQPAGCPPVRLSVSIGAASGMPGTPISAMALLRTADTALYRAKQDGRDCVRPQLAQCA